MSNTTTRIGTVTPYEYEVHINQEYFSDNNNDSDTTILEEPVKNNTSYYRAVHQNSSRTLKETPYACPIDNCTSRFTSSQNLACHRKTKHNYVFLNDKWQPAPPGHPSYLRKLSDQQ